MRDDIAVMIVAAIAAIGGLMGLFTGGSLVNDLADPCRTWGRGSGEPFALSEDCPQRSGSSQTRAEAVLGWLAIWGVLLVGSGLAVRGALHRDGQTVAFAGTVHVALVPPLGLGVFWIPMLAAGLALFVAAAHLPRPPSEAPRSVPTAGVVAAVAALVLMSYLAADRAFFMAAFVLTFSLLAWLPVFWLHRTRARVDAS